MTLLPPGVKVHLAFGYIDMRKGINGLAMLVQGVLRQDPFSGHLFVFRGRKANLIKIVFWDGTGQRDPPIRVREHRSRAPCPSVCDACYREPSEPRACCPSARSPTSAKAPTTILSSASPASANRPAREPVWDSGRIA